MHCTLNIYAFTVFLIQPLRSCHLYFKSEETKTEMQRNFLTNAVKISNGKISKADQTSLNPFFNPSKIIAFILKKWSLGIEEILISKHNFIKSYDVIALLNI